MLTLNWDFVNNWSFTSWNVRSTLWGWNGGCEIIESLPCSFYVEDQIFFLFLPQPPLLICTLFQLTSCLEIYHLDHKLININFFDVYWTLSLIYVLKYFKALCLAEFLLGFILPVPVCLRLPSSGFLLTMMNPEKVPAFDLCIKQEQGM